MKQVLTTGIIRSPHGIRGFLRVRPYADDFSHFFKLKTITAEKNSRQKELEIEEVQNYNGELLIKFKGIDNPEDARLLSGWELLVPRGQASKLGKNEIYTADLIGMKLIYDKEESGEVLSVFDGAQALLLEVRCNDSKIRLVPFLVGIFVDEVDVEKGTMRLLKKELVQ